MSRSESLDLLFPDFRNKLVDVLMDHNFNKSKEYQLYVFEGYRTPSRQNFLYGKGRITTETRVTNARAYESLHQYGLAADLVFGGPRKWSWDRDFAELGRVVNSVKGLKWGGNWGDEPHVEMELSKPVKETIIAQALEGKTTLDIWDYLLCLKG